jgi:hypothetical protein
MPMKSLISRRHRNLIHSLAIIAYALTSISMAQAQVQAGAAAAPVGISTV